MQVKKVILTVVLTAVIMSTLSLPAFAQSPLPERSENSTYATDNGIVISPFFTETSSAVANISKSGSNVIPEIIVKALKTTTKISGTLYLEKLESGSWKPVTSWSVSGTGTLSTYKTYPGTSGVTYRSRIVVTVGSEKIERSSSSCKA